MTDEQTSVVVCAADELAPGGMAAARMGMLPVVVVRTLDGELHGFVDRCLHQGARLSGGCVLSHAGGEILKCPWHGYEYDVRTGCAVIDARLALVRLDVRVEHGNVVARRAEMSGS